MKTNCFGHKKKGKAYGTTALSGEPQQILNDLQRQGGKKSVKAKLKTSERPFTSS